MTAEARPEAEFEADSEPESGAEARATPTVASRHIVVQGVRCHYLEAGDGPPLVLLHGTAFDSAALSYGPILSALASRHRILALDWPGYGESEAPRRASSRWATPYGIRSGWRRSR